MTTALVTGASAGLGVDFCHILAEQGFQLVLVARSEERMRQLAATLTAKYGITCEVIAIDLSHPGSATSLYEQMLAKSIKVDVLVNNAGSGVYGPLHTNSVTALSQMLHLNINSLAELTRLFLPDLIASRRGRILNVASTAGFQPGPGMAAYYASKAFVLSFSEAVGHELRGTGVSLTVLCPGPTRTEFFDRAGMGSSRLKNLFMADSRSCAERGIRALFKGKPIVIDGGMNYVLAQSIRILPRSLIRRLSAIVTAQAH